jgi:flagellar protein FlaI
MIKKIAICPKCHTEIPCQGEPGQKLIIKCPQCGKKGKITFSNQEESISAKKLVELDFYPVLEPFAYIKILKDTESLDKYYKVIEPQLSDTEQTSLNFIQTTLMNLIDIRLDELPYTKVEAFLVERIDRIIRDYKMDINPMLKNKILYYVKRDFLWYGKIDPLMRDPNIEDISCDGSNLPIFLYHRKYGSLKSNIQFPKEEILSEFVIKLAQKCGKHISIAEPMLDATMPDGSRIQITLSKAVTTKGSTFTIRKFRADPITATDLISYKTMSPEMVAYMWLAVENGVNALIAGGTAAGKTSTLNALCLFIPRESKIVTIEETREINLPHPNWIPGVVRSGFGEVINDKLAGEIDLYDLMKAALRQRPEYILVGEIRGKEAYVLFQAMATGHTTYSTVHADSPESLIHRLEGKPIEIPRVMLQALNIITIQVQAQFKDQRVRRCKQIVEIVDIDPMTKEILTNEVFRWDPVEDQFYYSGKSYVLEHIRGQHGMKKEEMMEELKRRVEILEWMRVNNIRAFKDVARIVASYAETPGEFMEKIRKEHKTEQVKSEQPPKAPAIEINNSTVAKETPDATLQMEETPSEHPVKTKKKIGFFRRDGHNTHEIPKS